ncbi:MAG: hypothetical protein ACAH27_13345 [Xanthobacteraceae bacterium]
MAKGQVRGNREVKKPKKPKEPAPAPALFAKGVSASAGLPKKKG